MGELVGKWGGGAAVQGWRIIKNRGSEGGQEGGRGRCLQRGVMMMHGNTRGNSPRLSLPAFSSLFYRSISDCASLPPSLWRFISPGRSPQGSAHLCLRSLSEKLLALPASPLFLSSTASHLTFCFSHITSLCFQVMHASTCRRLRHRSPSLPVLCLLDQSG